MTARAHDDGLVAGADGQDRAIGALMGLASGDALGASGPPPGAWTGVTAITLAIAESLLDRGEIDPADQARRCARWNVDGQSVGPLLEQAPLAIRNWRDADNARGLVAVVGSLIAGAPAHDLLWSDAWPGARRPREVVAVAEAGSFEEALTGSPGRVPESGRGDLAVVGLLAGARWGGTGIPPAWRAKLPLSERIASLAGNLFDAGSATRPARWPHDQALHAWWAPPVLAGEYPGHPRREQAASRLQLLLDAGVRTFLDLTTPADGLAPYQDVPQRIATTRGLEVDHLRFPIPDFGVIDRAGYDEILGAIAAAGDRGLVYVHCWGGIGRTGTVVGCLLVDSGLSADQALAAMDQARAGTVKAARRAPETDQQIKVIRSRARAAGG